MQTVDGTPHIENPADQLREELERTNSEVLRLTLELEDQVAERNADNERLRKEMARRQQAEVALRERTLQVETTNAELQAFCYSVSHDLRAPLRHIDGFSQALQTHCGEALDEEAQGLLLRVRAGCTRMDEQIEDLLALSRLSRQEVAMADVDISAIVTALTQTLVASAPERTVDFVIAEGVIVRGDERLLRVVVENLIGNAWKFTGLSIQPRIEFGRQQVEGEDTLFVQDNGVGFNSKYTERIFDAFQRLHSSEQFPGSGIGLATVQRAIHRHGGRIWADAEVGRGATFYFTLGEHVS